MVQNKNQSSKNDFPSYKATLNLLRTNFGMRANAVQREPELQAFWKEIGVDLKLGLENQGQPFTLHDGPPYANGFLHMGHALNKTLKDIINKYKILCGYKVRFVPGWDCHGLPIELKVLQNLDQDQRETLTSIKLRKKAAAYAKKQVQIQKVGFQRWGIWGDWENPYLTLQKEYESSQIKVFGSMVLKGHIYRGLKPVHWSPSSKTALAEAELEYPDGHLSPSIYVAFSALKLPNELRIKLKQHGLALPDSENDLSKVLKVLIWTTTPWTIPSNLAISVNPKLDYVFVKDIKGRVFIVADQLVSQLEEKLTLSLKKIALVKGADLEGISYKHPLLERRSLVVIGGDYITIDSGTGLVHTSPGHGIDDFNTARKYDLPIKCSVNEAGFLTKEAGQFEGLNVLKNANSVIIKSLESVNALLKEEPYLHRYPYDWRTKKPTIFRATEQWFASVNGFREQAIEAIDSTHWVPESGRNRIESMVRDRDDWCISRQRNWGVPIPVFYEKNGDKILLNSETLEYIQKLFLDHGSDIWWEKDESELLPSKYSQEAYRWKKGTDTMDVWFDSGSSWASVLNKYQELSYPADLYLEGSDQHRGWFQSSLLTSVAVNGLSPYKKVLTHGFALDEKGRKMSKSLGNVVDPTVIIEGGKNKKLEPPYGADVLRLWVSSVDYSVDVPIGSSILSQLSDVYRKIRNTARYLLGNLHDFDPACDAIEIEDLPILDKWMLNRSYEVFDSIQNSFENYEFSKFFQLIQSFCVVDLSNFYLDIAKDRLYVSSPSDFRRRSCQTVMSLILEKMAVIIAPVLCHMAEDIWQNIPYKIEEKSVFQRGWPILDESWKDELCAKKVSYLRDLRSSVNKIIEDCRNKHNIGSSLQLSVIINPKDESLIDSLDWLIKKGNPSVDSLKDWLLVSQLQISENNLEDSIEQFEDDHLIIRIARSSGKKCERCWHYETDIGVDVNHPLLCGRCINVLKTIQNN